MSKLLPADPNHKGVPKMLERGLKQEGEDRYGKITLQVMEEIVEEKIKTIANYLTPDRLRGKLEEASLKEIAIYEGTMMDKLLLLRGQPTQILGVQEQTKLDEACTKLLQEAQRRGVRVALTERKAEFHTGGQS